MMKNKQPPQSDIILYTSLDGKVRVNVLFGDETVWLTQKQIAQLIYNLYGLTPEEITIAQNNAK